MGLGKEMILCLANSEVKKRRSLLGTACAGLTRRSPRRVQPRASRADVWAAVGEARAGLQPHLHATEATTGCRAVCKHAGVRTMAAAEAVGLLSKAAVQIRVQTPPDGGPVGVQGRGARARSFPPSLLSFLSFFNKYEYLVGPVLAGPGTQKKVTVLSLPDNANAAAARFRLGGLDC